MNNFDNVKKQVYSFLGLPASGKGTQVDQFTKKHHATIIGIGDLVRARMEQGPSDDPLVVGMRKNYNAGIPQEDNVVFPLIEERLKSITGDVVFDNFPFSQNQITMLEKFIKENGWPEPIVIFLNVTPEVTVERIAKRRLCRGCGSIIIAANNEEVCTKCGGKLVVRADDNEETARARVERYLPRIREVFDHYAKMGRAIEVDGEQSIEDVSRELESKVEAFLLQHE